MIKIIRYFPISTLGSCLKQRLTKFRATKALRQLVKAGFPLQMVEPIFFLIGGKPDAPLRRCMKAVEQIRAAVEARGNETVTVLYSPPPLRNGLTSNTDSRPMHGQPVDFTMEHIAHLGKNRRWGAFLYLCSRAIQAQIILEMGACAGLSGCYLASSPQCKRFMTIEGSSALAQLAQHNLSQVTSNAVVYNELFDPAIG